MAIKNIIIVGQTIHNYLGSFKVIGRAHVNRRLVYLARSPSGAIIRFRHSRLTKERKRGLVSVTA